jgi:glycosyltransferase involved in cell wall biosynthesis
LPFGSQIARFVLKRSDAVLADGSHVRDTLDELLGWPSGAVIQPMGAWIDRFRPQKNAPENTAAGEVIFFVGRLVAKKGVTYLLRAMPIVLRQHPAARLVVGGGGPLEESLQNEAEQLGLARNVEFLGPLAHDEVVHRFQNCRVAVVPSVFDEHGETEGMPTVVVEAMAAGARVVGSEVAGIPDVIRHGENGWLARPGDPVDLAAQIIKALDDHGTGVIELAAATAREHDWSNVAHRYLAAFEAES